eukprot:6885934-Ditylum_brightwellii.AAC.1
MSIRSNTPIKKATSILEEDKSPTAAAESMANMGNLSGATKVLLCDTPVMHITDETRDSLFKYYPNAGANNTDTRVCNPCLDTSGHALNCPTNQMKNTHEKSVQARVLVASKG